MKLLIRQLRSGCLAFLPLLALTLPGRAELTVVSDWTKAAGKPANAALYGEATTELNDSTFAVHLLQNRPNTQGSMVLNTPVGGGPVHTLDVSFDFAMDGGTGADGFSFCYGDLPDGPWGEAGAGGGLVVQFVARSWDTANKGKDYVRVTYQGNQLGADIVVPLWRKKYEQTAGCPAPYSFQISLDTSRVLTWGLVSRTKGCEAANYVQRVPLAADWIPAPTWRFGLGARSGDKTMYVSLDHLRITAEVLPSLNPAPEAQQVYQDFTGSFPIFIASPTRAVADVQVTPVSSTDTDLLPLVNVGVTSEGAERRVTYTPARGKAGRVTLGLALTASGLPPTRFDVDITVAENIPPGLSRFPDPTVEQGRSLRVPFTFSSAHWPASNLLVSAKEQIGSDGALVQDFSAAVERNTDFQGTLVVTPRLDRTGQTEVTTTVTDGSGDSTTGKLVLTVVPATTVPTVAGARTALSFNEAGTDGQYGLDPAPGNLALGSSLTVEAWVRPSNWADPAFNPVLAWGPVVARQYGLFGFQSTGRPSFANLNNDAVPGTQLIAPLHVWSHVAWVISGRNVTFYLNGSQVASVLLPQSPNLANGPLYVGYEPAAGRLFAGEIDEVRIWNFARSGAQIQEAMHRKVAGTETGLVRYFDFDEGFHHFDAAAAGRYQPDNVSFGGSARDLGPAGRPLRLVGYPAYRPGVALDTIVAAAEDAPLSVPLVGALARGTNVSGAAGVAQEVYFGIPGILVRNLTDNSAYPDNPAAITVLGDGLEVPLNVASAYGERLRGYLLPPQTGDYTFWIAACNEAQLWLSTDDQTVNKKLVAAAPSTGIRFRQWTASPGQKSASFRLEAGRRYYFEALHVAGDPEESGDTHLSVRWQLPGGQIEEPIPAYRIQPVGAAPTGQAPESFLVELPEHGTATLTNGVLTYTPEPNFYGADDLVYHVVSGGLTSAVSRLVLNVSNLNDAPVAGSFRALELDGKTARLQTTTSLSLSNQSFTIEAWARRGAPGQPGCLVSQGGATTNGGLVLRFEADNTFRFGFWYNDLLTPSAYADTNWHHWAATFDAATGARTLYRDGVVVASDTTTNVLRSDPGGVLHLGSEFGGAPFFQGGLDEVRVWNLVRSREELAEWKAQPLRGSESGLVAYFRLDEGNGLTAHDSSAPKPGGLSYTAAAFNVITWLTNVTHLNTINVPRNSPGQDIYLPGFDPEGRALSYSIVGAEYGTVTGAGPVVTYRPAPNYYGPDQIIYRVSDGTRESELTQLWLNVAFLNLPPTLSEFRDQEVEEEDEPLVIEFTVADLDTPADQLVLTNRTSNPTLLPSSGITFGGTGTNRTVTLDPAEGEVGTATVTIEVSDGDKTVSRDFVFEVNPRLAFAVINLGGLTGQPNSIAQDINAAGQVVGFTWANTTNLVRRGFFYTGLGPLATMLPAGSLGGSDTLLMGVNAAGQAVGSSRPAGDPNLPATAILAHPQTDTALTNLGTLIGGTYSLATAVNDGGLIVGYGTIGDGSFRPFTSRGGPVKELDLKPAGYTNGQALAVNNAGVIVGTSEDGNAWIYTDTTYALGRPPGTRRASAEAVNEQNEIAGFAVLANGTTQVARHSPDAGWELLGDTFGGGDARAYDLDRFGRIVGAAKTVSGESHAFLYERGRAYDLNDLLPEDSGWVLTEARAINDQGQIVGQGLKDGRSQAFLLFPASEIGRRVFRPEGTLAQLPQIELLQGSPGDNANNAFFWSEIDQKLFAIRPVVALLRWHTGLYTTYTNETQFGDSVIRQVFTNGVLVPTISWNVWPLDPDLHVVGAPAQAEPKVPAFQHSFLELIHTTADGAAVDMQSKVFNTPAAGYSVLHYLLSRGQPANPGKQPNRFTVTRSVPWDDPRHLVTNLTAEVGVPVTHPHHDDYPGLNGFMYFTNAFYDGAGDDAAYVRAERRGPIIPVNAATSRNDFLTVWFQRNRIGVAWPDLPVLYRLRWPTNAPHLVIASQLGSEELDPLRHPDAHPYNQPDINLPGFNPNEEHALMAPAGRGVALFALRNDLNAASLVAPSAPFALLKHRDPATREWRIQPYEVVTEEEPYYFRYPGTAGTEIEPPYPLPLFPISTNNAGVLGPWWRDYRGRFYARAAGQAGGEADVVIHYFYPLQAGFFYDLDRDGTNDLANGTELPWLDRRPGGVQGTPVDVTFEIHWPSDVPTLAQGETLFGAAHGLPDVADMASVQVIYDALNPDGQTPLEQLARLFDPLTARTVPLPAGFEWPDAITRSTDPVTGHEVFPDLPYHLRVRFFHDPGSHRLGFQGFTRAQPAGPPLTLINVMTERERDRIQQLDGGAAGSEFDNLIQDLYHLTRNPNQLDVSPPDGKPDEALLIGLAYDATGTNVVAERLEGAKALTAGLPVHTVLSAEGTGLQFNGVDGTVESGPVFPNVINSFSVEFWARPSGPRKETEESADGIRDPGNQRFAFAPLDYNAYGAGHATAGVSVGTNGVSVFLHGSYLLSTPLVHAHDFTDWTHVAVVFEDTRPHLYLNGELVRVGQALPANLLVHPGGALGGLDARPEFGHYAGELDEVRVWNRALTEDEIRARIAKHLIGAEAGLVGYWRLNDAAGVTVRDSSPGRHDGTLAGGVTWQKSTAPVGILPRFQVLVENNDPKLGGLPVTLHVIRVEGGPYVGSLQVILPDNALDERVTVRHNSDFAGDPRGLEFEWYYHPAGDGQPPAAPDPDDPTATGWFKFPQGGDGVNDITLGEGELSSLITLSDNWFFARYRGYDVDGQTNWTGWIGDPASTTVPRPMLVEGWIKRVLAGINLFDQRNRDFNNHPVNTLISALAQAGARYEGDIALNPATIDTPGLIQIYQTVLNRGRKLSIDATPPVDYAPADNALLLAAGNIADLYVAFGNEAFADAADPTIGLNPALPSGGSLASSIFAFENQVDSLLDEELVLLRGRDDSSAGVGAGPVYNRLFWNFTRADGQVAYTQTYNLSDYNDDGFLDAEDAAILYPQGHGDAWGHYLTALTTYHGLLRATNFTWIPQTEAVTIGGVPIEVGYEHERKYAAAAAALARTGAEVVARTHRLNYSADPADRWQGYPDRDPARAWGVGEWGRRAGQGAYFAWVTGNAMLPAVDPDPTHAGLRKIDRTTVRELSQVVAEAISVQNVCDAADGGLNPLGLDPDAVPFDVDPDTLLTPFFRFTHFDQVYDRALEALKNAATSFRQASELTDGLRAQADSQSNYGTSVQLQELAYRNQLIEVFGYPYAGDIGPGTPNPAGYVGPDLYHWMYVDTLDVTAQNDPRGTNFTALYRPFQEAADKWGFQFSADTLEALNVASNEVLEVEYPVSTETYAFQAPVSWGSRRAEGRLQTALRDMVQGQAALRQAATAYENHVTELEAQLELLEARYGLSSEKLGSLGAKVGALTTLNVAIAGARAAKLAAEILGEVTGKSIRAAAQALPRVIGLSTDALATARGVLVATALVPEKTFSTLANVAEVAEIIADLGKDLTEVSVEFDLESAAERFELQERLKELEGLVRAEAGLRLSLFQQAQSLIQAARAYEAALAEGQRLLEQRLVFRQNTAGVVSQMRYRDDAFRIFRNDAVERYDAQFELAARYVHLAAKAYDYEVNGAAGDVAELADQVVRERNVGELRDGVPTAGRRGLASILARLRQNFDVLKPTLGLNNTRDERARFSLRTEWQRLLPPGVTHDADVNWVSFLQQSRMTNLWELPEFRAHCRPFAPESAGPQPGLVLDIDGATITAGQNYFGWPVGPLDSAYDPSEYSTRIRSVAVWFSGYDQAGLAAKPRVYLVPVGADILRAPGADDFTTRTWRIVEQKVPIPFPLSAAGEPWLAEHLGVTSGFADLRRHSAFRAYHDSVFDTEEFDESTRLVGRSVWNTRWVLIIPGAYLLGDPDKGLDQFINSVDDIKLYFQTYSASGN